MGKENIGGVAETMLQTLYARAKESQTPKRKIYDLAPEFSWQGRSG